MLDELTLELTVDGVEAEIERKPLEVLMHLLAHAGEVVTKDELLAAVWPGRILSDTVLTKGIGRVREVLKDADQSLIKTVYGYGYRLMAPVRVELQRAPERAHFDFNPGDHPPGRPLWSLVHRLGAGGHGEAWLGQHDKTREQRVFKFAIDEQSLTALKREITLFRFLNDSLGDRARIVPLIDWNLEQPPCFIESQYIAGGSLLDWAERGGGLAKIPMATRLEVAAQIAEALATIHSVGVLHKDLKPSNILIETGGDVPLIRLADFGSGGVLDTQQLEALGITRMGFTKTVAAINTTSGTPLYLAPELLAGQPPTVQADIYALGVMLYQLVIGEFRKAMNAGWERDVDDELLRADIAQAAEGDPLRRLSDAGELAQRLRDLEPRRALLAEQREAQARAERAKRAQDHAKARRVGLVLAFAVLVVGLIVSSAMFLKARESQQRAQVAAAQSKAVTEFLSNVFAPVSSGKEPVKDKTVTELLKRAGEEIDSRFAAQPEIASELHWIVGKSLDHYYETPDALPHLRRAFEMDQQLGGLGSEAATFSAAKLIPFDYSIGILRRTISRYEEALRFAVIRLRPDHPAVLELRFWLARGRYLLGDWQMASAAMRVLLNDLQKPGQHSSSLVGPAEYTLGQILTDLAQPLEAQQHLQRAIVHISADLGERHGNVADARSELARALIDSGQFAEAQSQLDEARVVAAAWAPPGTWTFDRPRVYAALLLSGQGRSAEAETILSRFVSERDAERIAYEQQYPGKTLELERTVVARQALGEVLGFRGQVEEGIRQLKTALTLAVAADDSPHPCTRSIRLSLAALLLAKGRDSEAVTVMTTPMAVAFEDLPSLHPYQAQLHRVNALLALHHGDRDAARVAFNRSLAIELALHPSNRWNVDRLHRDLLEATH